MRSRISKKPVDARAVLCASAEHPDESMLHGEWSVCRRGDAGHKETIETDLPEEVARQMVADYAAEGETVWMERTAPAPE